MFGLTDKRFHFFYSKMKNLQPGKMFHIYWVRSLKAFLQFLVLSITIGDVVKFVVKKHLKMKKEIH